MFKKGKKTLCEYIIQHCEASLIAIGVVMESELYTSAGLQPIEFALKLRFENIDRDTSENRRAQRKWQRRVGHDIALDVLH